jgi:DNA-binding Lrp family transcriptional regulator
MVAVTRLPKPPVPPARPAQGLRFFVLVQAVPGRVATIVRSLHRLRQVSAVHPVTGPYDIIALLEVGDAREISQVVAGTIGGMRGVTRTTTLLCAE